MEGDHRHGEGCVCERKPCNDHHYQRMVGGGGGEGTVPLFICSFGEALYSRSLLNIVSNYIEQCEECFYPLLLW